MPRHSVHAGKQEQPAPERAHREDRGSRVQRIAGALLFVSLTGLAGAGYAVSKKIWK